MNRFSSIFSQLLQLFPRVEFQHLVTITQAERHAKGFPCWGQFVAMLFCHLGRAHSLREITGGLRSCEGKLKHLGITAPSRSLNSPGRQFSDGRSAKQVHPFNPSSRGESVWTEIQG